MTYRPLSAVVMAAGEGTRMRSATPKVLHPLCGRPMLLHVLDALAQLPLERVVIVVGHGAEQVTKTTQDQAGTDVPIAFVEQHVQRGTGDAAGVALTAFPDELDGEDDLLILPGDTPLLRAETLAAVATAHRESDAAATVLSARVADPTGYGRVVRDDNGNVAAVTEHRDADDGTLAIDEVNTSIYCFRRGLLAPALRRLSPENSQGEYYLTDALAVLREAGHVVAGVEVDDAAEAQGVNDRAQLADAEAALRERINGAWMRDGVTMVDPATTYVDTDVELAADVRLLPGTSLEGHTVVGRGSVIGPHSRLVDTVVGEEVTVASSTVLESELDDRSTVGPYSHVRPGTHLGVGAKIGSFVETKNAEIGDGAKVPHLSYVGDAEVGEGSNLGAGTITANYDGNNKHRTVIGKRVHTGSNTVLVAPVELGDDAGTGAGAVVTRDVPPGHLAKGVPARSEEMSGDDEAADGED